MPKSKNSVNFLGKVSELFVPSGFDNFASAAGLLAKNTRSRSRKLKGGSEVMGEEPELGKVATETSIPKDLSQSAPAKQVESQISKSAMIGGKRKKTKKTTRKQKGGAEVIDGHMTEKEMFDMEKHLQAQENQEILNYQLGPLSGGGKKKKTKKTTRKNKKGGFNLNPFNWGKSEETPAPTSTANNNSTANNSTKAKSNANTGLMLSSNSGNTNTSMTTSTNTKKSNTTAPLNIGTLTNKTSMGNSVATNNNTKKNIVGTNAPAVNITKQGNNNTKRTNNKGGIITNILNSPPESSI